MYVNGKSVGLFELDGRMAVISVVGMEQPRLWIAVVVAMMMIPFNCLATYYTVGGNSGWKPGVNYTAWASGQQFVVGDYLVFNYTVGRHNTMVVHKRAYVSCNSSNALETYTSGNDTILLSSTGHKYFLCGYPTHCTHGMRLAITVGHTSNNSPSPSPTTC